MFFVRIRSEDAEGKETAEIKATDYKKNNQLFLVCLLTISVSSLEEIENKMEE
ncbi:MAG: hypothetical protein L0K82_00740 [Pisciglobus halotolerans]|nr:hypothetical protein [Pisciglobus halotolerans]